MNNYFSLHEGSVQMHGFDHLSDRFYVKSLINKNSLVIYVNPHADCLEIKINKDRMLDRRFTFLFHRYHMLNFYFIYVEPTKSYLATNIAVTTDI